MKYVRKGVRLCYREIDYVFNAIGLDDLMHPTSRPIVIAILILVPFVLLIVLVFCWNDPIEDDAIKAKSD